MPEGPEIRRAADHIFAAVGGQEIEDVHLGPARLGRFRERLIGTAVSRVDTRGKAMLTRFDNHLILYSHNQLYGRWYVVKRGQIPNTARQLRVALHTAHTSALLYSATDIDILTADRLATHPFLSKLGPDILDRDLGWRAVAKRLCSREFAGRGVGNLYLDQSFLAGVGNYLRSEILFHAGVYPFAKPRELSQESANILARQTLSLADRAYKTGGITSAASLVRRLKVEGVRRADYRHAVFGRAGQRCYVCDAVIERVNVGARRLRFRPVCQRPVNDSNPGKT